MIRRQVRQNPREAGKHPTIAAAPEDLVAVGITLLEETAVAIEQVIGRIVQIVGRCPELRIRMRQVASIAGSFGERDPRGWRHEYRITPTPPGLTRLTSSGLGIERQ